MNAHLKAIKDRIDSGTYRLEVTARDIAEAMLEKDDARATLRKRHIQSTALALDYDGVAAEQIAEVLDISPSRVWQILRSHNRSAVLG